MQSQLRSLKTYGSNLYDIDYLKGYAGPHRAVKPSSVVSSKYNFVSTEAILDALKPIGFGVSSYERQRVKTNADDRYGFEKHMIRLRRFADIGKSDAAEIILTNSHDLTAAFSLFVGIYRLVCSNGLVASSKDYGFTLKHNSNADDIIDASFRVIDQANNLLPIIDDMKAIVLSNDQRMLFADAALSLKYDDHSLDDCRKVVDTVRRFDDKDKSLWTTFNVVQENIIKGGIRLPSKQSKKSRAVTSINANLSINKGLWQIAESFI